MRICSAIALVMVAAYIPSVVYADYTVVDKTASYTGPITTGDSQALFRAVNNRHINRLIITSSGGEVVAGIALGRWVYKNKLTVEVKDYCLSSCANYVFPAGQKKIIQPGAIVAWHGNYHHLQATGLWREEIARRRQKTGESLETATRYIQVQVESLVLLERQFFAEIGVDQKICWVGKMPPYNVPNYYFMSGQDMARFGLRGLELPDNYEGSDVSVLADDIRLVRLEPR